jgi:hypothetical protein
MSFTNNVYGGVPQNEMVFTTSNVSSDNASFINLSVSDSATITNLTTVNWSQPNLNASTVVTDTLVVTNTSAVNLDVSGVMNVSDLNISDLNVSDISVSTISVGDIVVDEAEVTTLRFDDVTNANYSEIQRDNDTLTIAGGYATAQGIEYTGDIAFTPYNLSNATPPSMVVQASDGKVYIPNMSALDINTSNISVATLMTTNQLTATGLAQFQSTLSVMNPTSQTQNFFWNTQGTTAFQLGNLALVDFNIGNDASNPNKGIIVRGGTNSSVEIPILTADNLSSTTANISTLNVSTVNVADITIPDINTSQLNASNISVDVNLSVAGTTQTDILEADIISAGCDMTSTLETSTNMYYPNNLLIDYSATQVATTIELSSNLSLNDIELLPDLITAADPTFSMLSGTAQITNANISTLTCDQENVSQINASNISIDADLSVVGTATITDAAITTLTCDLTPNLTAGTGITITSVGGKPTISSSTAITDPLNLSTLNASQINASNISIDENLSVAGYGYVRWDLNVSNTLYTAANVDAGNSVFANANMIAGGNVTSPVYNFKRTVADGGLTMATFAANANSLDLSMSYDWNIYKSNNSGVRLMQFDFSAGNVNMSNASINNLSVTSVLTTPDATITDLVIPGTVSIPGILNHDFSKNVTAGAGINITHVGNQMTIAATSSGVTDPLNLSTLNASQINASNISVATIQPAFINASTTHTEALNVSGSAAFLGDGLTVYGQTALQNTSITNLSTTTLTCDLTPNLTAGTGITITSVGGKPTITATGGSVTDPLNLSKLNASNISVDSGITTATLAATGNILTEDSFTFRTDSFTAFTITNSTNPTEYRLSTTSSNQDIRICNATGAGGLLFDAGNNDINISQLNASNIDVDADITTDTLTCDLTPNLTAGTGISITSVGNKPTITAVNSVSANVPVSDFIETLQIIPSGTNAFVNQAVGQGSQLISVYDFQGGTAYTAANLFTVNAGDKIHFNWKQSGWVQTAPGQQSYVICYIVKGTNAVPQPGDRIEVGRIYQYIYSQSDHEEISGSFVYNVTSTFSFYRSQMEGAPNLVTQSSDYGAATATVYRATIPNSIVIPQTLNVSQFNASNIDVDANITTDTLTCDLTPNLTAGTGITITSVGGKPTITATGGGGVTDPLNISKLNASNISVDEDVTIGRDLNVQRYFDSGRPRFMMLARTTDLAQTGAGERLMLFNTNSTGQVAGEFGVTNGGEIQVSTGGWYRLSWSIGFIRTSSGNRYSFRSYNMTRTNAGGWTFVQLKDRIGSIGYCRSNSLNQETCSVGNVLRYIPANGWVKLNIGAMVQGSTNFSSTFTGTNLRASSNFMVEFISSASET